MILLNENSIRENLNHSLSTQPLILHVIDTIDSTNKYLKNLDNADDEKSIHICCAETQTQGRGRFNRHWHSPFGENIYFSMRVIFPQTILVQLSSLSLVVALSVLQVCQQLGVNDNLMIKWPNDILYIHKKICGILLELSTNSANHIALVIGIGINVNSKSTNHPWCSIYDILNQELDRNIIISKLISQLIPNIIQWQQHGFTSFLEQWQSIDYLYKKTILVQNNNHILQGCAMGVNQYGHLQLLDNLDFMHSLISGEATIKNQL